MNTLTELKWCTSMWFGWVESQVSNINCHVFPIKFVLTLLPRMLPAQSNRRDIIAQPLQAMKSPQNAGQEHNYMCGSVRSLLLTCTNSPKLFYVLISVFVFLEKLGFWLFQNITVRSKDLPNGIILDPSRSKKYITDCTFVSFDPGSTVGEGFSTRYM